MAVERSSFQRALCGEGDDHLFSVFGSVAPPLGAVQVRVQGTIEGTAANVLAMKCSAFIVYHVQDEQGRNGTARPFSYQPGSDPLDFAVSVAAQLHTLSQSCSVPPCILFQVTPLLTREKFDQVLDLIGSTDSPVAALTLVGPPHAHTETIGYSQLEAAALVHSRFPSLPLGGLILPERHLSKHDEHHRIFTKQSAGISFFITQVIYDPTLLIDVLTLYVELLDNHPEVERAPRVILTFAPVSCQKTLDFLAWLGVNIPAETAKRIIEAENPSEESVAVCAQNFSIFLTAVKQLKRRIPIGFSVEVVTGFAAERNIVTSLHSALANVFAQLQSNEVAD